MERIKVAREAEADLGGEMRTSTNPEQSQSERNKADLGGEKRIPTSTTATPSRTPGGEECVCLRSPSLHPCWIKA